MPRRRLVEEGSFQESRGRHGGGDRESIQRRISTRHLDDPDGHNGQVAGARQDPRDVDRYRAGVTHPQEL